MSQKCAEWQMRRPARAIRRDFVPTSDLGKRAFHQVKQAISNVRKTHRMAGREPGACRSVRFCDTAILSLL